MPRMQLLKRVEREVFDLPPTFNSAGRRRCFAFPIPI